MEVMIPTTQMEFNFDSSNNSPYISAPSSPQQIGAIFFSAPTSPTKSSAFYKEFTSFRGAQAQITDQHVSAVPFNWEVSPGIPKTMENFNFVSENIDEDEENSRDFAFDFSSHLETCSLTADELFDGGKIKPLKPPPRLQLYEGKLPGDSLISPKSPRSPKRLIKDVLSPRHKRNDFDPFAAAHKQTCRESSLQGRGRERTTSRQKKTRSLSPFRVSDLLMDSKDQINQEGISNSKRNNNESSLFPSSPSSFASFWYRNKWKLKDLLLFRSASEGRATNEDQIKKYGMLKKHRQQEDIKNSSFRSTDSIGSTTSISSNSRRRVPVVSAHELHYTANRAVSEEMKKKTFLPYKRSLLGCLGLTSGMHIHQISKEFGSLSRHRA